MHGPPGSGKTTLGRAVTEQLIAANRATGMIDLDALSLVYPVQGRSFTRNNLRAVWPNYAAVPHIRLVLPLVVVDEADLAELRDITAAARFTVCELSAPRAVLEQRVRAREPNEFWTSRVIDFIDMYDARDDHPRIRDFQASTHPERVEDTARQVLKLCGW